MEQVLNCKFIEMSYDELQVVDGGGLFEFFKDLTENVFVAVCTIGGGVIGSSAGPIGTVVGGSAGAIAGQATWDKYFK